MGDVDLVETDIAPPLGPPTERLRRALTAFAAALIGAQPLCVPSDDVPAPIGTLTLTLGWWLLLATVALWRILTRSSNKIFGPIAFALIALSVCLAIRTAWGTTNDWRSWQSVWQWAALPAAYLAMRELTRNPDDSRNLIAVMLATGLAALAVYLAPPLATAFGFTWPEMTQNPRLLPDGYTAIESSLDPDELRRAREWCSDVFWIALLLPVATAFAASLRRSPTRRHRLVGWTTLAVVVAAIGLRLAFAPPPAPQSWRPSLDLTIDAPAGIGAGLFSRFSARYAAPTTDVVIGDAANSYLGLASVGGWCALAFFIGALVMLFKSLGARRQNLHPLLDYRPRWELQAGGVVGVLIGLALQVQDWPAASDPPIVALAFSAAIRVIVWCLAFSRADVCMMSSRADHAVPWSLIAVAALALINDVLQPPMGMSFWIVAALAMNLRPGAQSALVRRARGQNFIFLALTAVAFASFAWLIYVPAVVTHLAEHRFVRTVPLYSVKANLLRRAEGPIGRAAGHGEAARFVRRSILQPLVETTRVNPRDPSPPLLRVPWYVALAEHGGDNNPAAQAVLTAQAAAELDFENVAPFLAEFQAHLRLAPLPNTVSSEHYSQAKDLIAEIVRRDPALEAAARAHFAIALTDFDRASAREQAELAQRLDAIAPSNRYRLSDSLREQLRKVLTR